MSKAKPVLSCVDDGQPGSSDCLPLVYEQLRRLACARLARERCDLLPEAAELVHETYLRLVTVRGSARWDNLGHFFAAAAHAMRRILVEWGRNRKRLKRGGTFRRLDLGRVEFTPCIPPPDKSPELHAALARLSAIHPDKAAVVRLRYFSGLTGTQAAKVLGVSPATVDRHLAFAKTWLRRALSEPGAF